MNVIFLDFDGVLNTKDSVKDGVHLIPPKVQLLRIICEKTNAKIVISSSWRITYSLNEIKIILERGGLKKIDVRDVTVFSETEFRGDEVEEWVKKNNPDKYIILDDQDNFHNYQKKFFVKINPEKGLVKENAIEAINLFGLYKT